MDAVCVVPAVAGMARSTKTLSGWQRPALYQLEAAAFAPQSFFTV
jgi:hypothetical protein